MTLTGDTFVPHILCHYATRMLSSASKMWLLSLVSLLSFLHLLLGNSGEGNPGPGGGAQHACMMYTPDAACTQWCPYSGDAMWWCPTEYGVSHVCLHVAQARKAIARDNVVQELNHEAKLVQVRHVGETCRGVGECQGETDEKRGAGSDSDTTEK